MLLPSLPVDRYIQSIATELHLPVPTYKYDRFSPQFSNVNDTRSFYQRVQDIILSSAP